MQRKALLWFLSIFVVIIAACGGGSPSAVQNSSDLSIVAGSNARLFLGESYESDGLLRDFYKEEGIKIYVEYLGGPEAEAIKTASLGIPTDEKTAQTFDAYIFDDQLFATGLKDIVFPARAYVGVWIKQDKANTLGLSATDPYLTHEQYANYLESGQLKIVTAPASKETAPALEFFATMAFCSGNSSAQLTVETVQAQKNCGQRIYDHYVRSAGTTSEAVDMVVNDSLNGSNLFDGVVAFQSSFAGEKGLNQKLVDSGKQPLLFFYFKDAAPLATMVLGNTGNLTEEEKTAYDQLAAFIVTEETQQTIADHAFMAGSDAFGVELDLKAFNPNWGLTLNPVVAPINPPVYVVASQALDIYRDYYKRQKIVDVLLDVSPSMFQNNMTVLVDGKQTDVLRIQALDTAMFEKVTNSQWLAGNKIQPGLKDQFRYSFFSSMYSETVVQTIGPNTDAAGDRLHYFLGATTDVNTFNAMTSNELNGFMADGTHIFDAATNALDQIIAEYDPNVDYYIVILTDGENDPRFGLQANDFYSHWNQFAGKANVTVIGIAFGTEGNSINKNYTALFGGNTYKGNNDAELVEAFKQIIGR